MPLRDSSSGISDRAQDAVQETLVRCWRDLPTLRDIDRFDAWLNRLFLNACRDELRHVKRRSIEVTVPETLPHTVPDGQSALADRDQLENGLRRLEPEHRTVIVLHYYLGLPLPDAAAAMGIPLGTAKSRLHRATQALRATLDADSRSRHELTEGSHRMNQRDDLDRRLTAWLDDPYSPPAPAYLGAVLERTRRTPQRRSWASLERWLPMTITLRRPMLAPSMRLLAIGLALMLALLAALAAVPVLSRLGLLQATVAVPWHNGLIAFSRDGDIWVVDPNGGDPKVLIGGSQAVDEGPDWSPDGTQIAFWRSVGAAKSLMVADADGSNIRQVTKAALTDPTGYWWSPDGSRFVIQSTIDRQPAVSLVNVDGTDQHRLQVGVPVTDASWSPDGTSLLLRAYTPEGTTLYPWSVADATLGAPIIRSDTASAFYAGDRGINDLLWPSWSPDGSRIAYTNGQLPADGKAGVFGGSDTRNWVVSADGSDARMVEFAADFGL